MGGHLHSPAAFITGKDPVPIVQEAGWTPRPVWIGAENLAPPGFDPRTVQLVGSRYPAHVIINYFYKYSAIGPVWAETRAQSGDWYSSGTLHPGKFLGVGCHFSPPPFETFPLSSLGATTSVTDSSGGRWNCARGCCPVILPK